VAAVLLGKILPEVELVVVDIGCSLWLQPIIAANIGPTWSRPTRTAFDRIQMLTQGKYTKDRQWVSPIRARGASLMLCAEDDSAPAPLSGCNQSRPMLSSNKSRRTFGKFDGRERRASRFPVVQTSAKLRRRTLCRLAIGVAVVRETLSCHRNRRAEHSKQMRVTQQGRKLL